MTKPKAAQNASEPLVGVKARPGNRTYVPEVSRAHLCGLTLTGLQRLRSLVTEQVRCTWGIGDLLVEAYGTPPPPGVMDGSREPMGHLADELGKSLSWLVSCRLTAAAWPLRERRISVAWACHRDLRARADRFAVMSAFADDCARGAVTPSAGRLQGWLEAHREPDRHSERDTSLRLVGRRKVSPVDRVERLAAALGAEQLAELVARLQARLAVAAA